MNAREFLYQLWGDKSDEGYILIWTLQGENKFSYFRRTAEEAAQVVAGLGNVDTYVGVGLSPQDYGIKLRCLATDVIAITGAWADFDLKSAAHDKPLPATIEDALSLIPPELQPTLIIITGNGIHCWWLLREIFYFEKPEDRELAQRTVYRLQNLLKLAAGARGWKFDRLADLARVLRVPGTKNLKDTANPKPVTVYRSGGPRYNLSDLEWYLDQAGIPGPEGETRPLASSEPEPAGTARRGRPPLPRVASDLVINLNAEIPKEDLELWTEGNPRFRQTWFRQRRDMPDQSQSGYDLALADFGFDLGLKPQQIVDLIVHHRRLHNQKARTRIDYFERTLGRAAVREGVAGGTAAGPPADEEAEEVETEADAKTSTEPGAKAEAADQAKPIDTPPAATTLPADPMLARAARTEQLANDLRIPLLRISCTKEKNPTYLIEFYDGSTAVEMPSIDALLSQKAWRNTIAGALHHFIPPFSRAAWNRLSQTILDAIVTLDLGPETDSVGSLRVFLDQYLGETRFVTDLTRQPAKHRQHPTILEDRVAISSLHLRTYLAQRHSLAHSPTSMARAIEAIGAVKRRIRIPKTSSDYMRWLLPADDYPPENFVNLRPNLDPDDKEPSDE